jgi:sporulation-control protein
MFDTLLARIGIGAATVDTYLENTTVTPGDLVRGEIVIQGGQVPQTMTKLYARLMTRYKSDDRVHNFVLASQMLSDGFQIEPEVRWAQPFELQVPYHTPLTMLRTPVYLVTALDLPGALDPKDTDSVTVRPHPLQARVLTAIDQLGFQLWQDETEYHGQWARYGSPVVQELEFRPSGAYRHHLRELEVMFHLDQQGLDVFLEIDRRARGLGLLFEGLNERHTGLRFTINDLQRSDWTAQIKAAIDQQL